MDVEADFDHALDDGLDLFFGRAFLHCNNHVFFSCLSWLGAPGMSGAAGCGREASSLRCSARMTSMMRS